ncbi:hypothetical protein ABT147_45830 [Streptomyces sp. NPDC001868]|uniref:hypothetical protein n=1 Tax=Streptomyces sp. NPDC001868 TaxID=3154401 RepID=UPI0033168C0D
MNEPDPSLQAQRTAAAYAQALRAALQPVLERGATQAGLARSTNVVPATVSRYLNPSHDGRIAPEGFLNKFADFLGERGSPLPPQDLAGLHDLRRAAQRTSTSPEIRTLYLREELARIKEELTSSEGQRKTIEAQLSQLDQRLIELSGELAAALARAQAAEAGQGVLQATVEAQDHQLGQARNYTRQIERELAEQQEQVRYLHAEVEVLRGQVLRLQKEPAPPAEETISGVATQVSSVSASRMSADWGQAGFAAAPLRRQLDAGPPPPGSSVGDVAQILPARPRRSGEGPTPKNGFARLLAGVAVYLVVLAFGVWFGAVTTAELGLEEAGAKERDYAYSVFSGLLIAVMECAHLAQRAVFRDVRRWWLWAGWFVAFSFGCQPFAAHLPLVQRVAQLFVY